MSAIPPTVVRPLRNRHRTPHCALAGGGVASVDQVLDARPKGASDPHKDDTAGVLSEPARDLREVPTAPQSGEGLQLLDGQPRDESDQCEDSVAERDGVMLVGHVTNVRSHDERSFVKDFDADAYERGEDAPVSPRKPPREESPIAKRIRERIAEMGQTESGLAEALGRDRTHISTQLRRLDAGGNLRSDTLQLFERALGKSSQWILTGQEPEGVRISDVPGWAEVAVEATSRYKLPPEAVEAVGRMRVPAVPARFDAAFVGALARAWSDAS